MFTDQQKAWCVIDYAKTQSPKTTQRNFRIHYRLSWRASIPNTTSIRQWYTKFMDSGSVKRKKRANTKWAQIEINVEEVLAAFREEPHLSLRKAANRVIEEEIDGEVQLLTTLPSKTTIHRILKDNQFHPYKLKMLHKIPEPNHNLKRVEFSIEMLDRIQEVFDNLPQEMIDRSIQEFERRLDVCINVNGELVEQPAP